MNETPKIVTGEVVEPPQYVERFFVLFRSTDGVEWSVMSDVYNTDEEAVDAYAGNNPDEWEHRIIRVRLPAMPRKGTAR